MKYLFRFSTLFLILLFHSVWSQYEIEERSIHYRPGDWVSFPVMRFMTSITLDYDVAYFGSTGGIARFDFFQKNWLEPITVSDGLADDHIQALFLDENTGYLWCGTKTGLSYRVPGADQWRNLSYSLILENGTLSSRVIAFGQGKKDLWVKDDRGWFYRGGRVFGNFSLADQEGADEDYVRWNVHDIKNEDLFMNYFIEQGYLLGPEPEIEDRYARKYRVVSTLKDNFDRLFVATDGIGAGVADVKTRQLELYPFGPFSSGFEAIAWDDEGMWIGGRPEWDEENAITWWNMDRDEWIHYEAKFQTELRSDRVTSVAPDIQYVWFGTDEGLVRYDKTQGGWKTFNVRHNLWDDRITSLALTDSILWVGTQLGINWMELSTMNINRVMNQRLRHRIIHHIEADGEDVWAGTDRGLFRFRGGGGSWEFITGSPLLISLDVTAISVFDKEVWCGRMDGIEVLDQKTNTWRGFSDTQYPTSGPFHVILADSSAVWFGTENGVLKYIKEEDRWRRFTTEDGLLDNSVRWILLDWDYIWFATQKGLTRFYWNSPYRID